MMRDAFTAELAALSKDVEVLGSLCENSLELLVQALSGNTKILAEEIRLLYKRIEDKEHEIENTCLTMLIKQQPVATDLRRISAALKIVHDCKRIGDQAANIGEIFAESYYTETEALESLRKMAQGTRNMFVDSMESFIKGDANLASMADAKDDQIDKLFILVKRDLLQMISNNIDNGEQALDYLLIAKYFEKMSDHAVHIAHWALYDLTGVRQEDNA